MTQYSLKPGMNTYSGKSRSRLSNKSYKIVQKCIYNSHKFILIIPYFSGEKYNSMIHGIISVFSHENWKMVAAAEIEFSDYLIKRN